MAVLFGLHTYLVVVEVRELPAILFILNRATICSLLVYYVVSFGWFNVPNTLFIASLTLFFPFHSEFRSRVEWHLDFGFVDLNHLDQIHILCLVTRIVLRPMHSCFHHILTHGALEGMGVAHMVPLHLSYLSHLSTLKLSKYSRLYEFSCP